MSGLGSRSEGLDRLASTTAEPLDLLVVGGGITGAGVALDAASRGMEVGLVERSDFASGTSSKSSKLVHGGLRYLEQREFGLMREAAQERDLLRRLAPQLVEPVPFVLPVADRWMRAKFGVGLWAYDALASFKNLAVHRYLGVDETEAAVPSLPEGKVKGGFLFYDCKSDDVRLVMEVLIQAVRYGATPVNYARVVDIEGGDDACEVHVEDRISGEVLVVRTRKVIVASGVWGDQVERLATGRAEPRLRPSKGIHLAFSRERLPMAEAAAFIPDVERNRMLFVIPWLDSVIVGTTDTPYEGDIDRPTVTAEDRRYVIDSVDSVFPVALTEEDVVGAWAGLRPLIAGEGGSTADLSRKHTIYDIAPGVVGITGGKLTTYRRMAKDVVDRVAEDAGQKTGSKTHWIRLGCSDVSSVMKAVARRGRRHNLDARQIENLVRCYGDRALAVLDVAEETGGTGRLAPGFQPIEAEAVYCARAEMVVHLNDLLARRTRLALVDPAGGNGASARAPELLASELGWSDAVKEQEETAHAEAVERERGMPLRDPDRGPVSRGRGTGTG